MRWLSGFIGLVALCGVAGWALTRPASLAEADIAGIEPDLALGEVVFHAAGCASCHAAPDAEGNARLVLAGGYRIDTDFGTFVAPNISQDNAHGIGDWSRTEIVSAIMKGTSPDGRHYYPAFPYAAYAKAELRDIVSLAAYLETLPADPTPSAPHELRFPATIRAGVGLWKFVNLGDGFALDVGDDPVLVRGQYLAEALAHCGECHTPRDLTQGLDLSRWFAGAPNPSGKGRIPNISPAKLDWSAGEISAYLTDGFTPEFDVAAGFMADVVEGTSRLSDADRAAIAAYVKAVPASE